MTAGGDPPSSATAVWRGLTPRVRTRLLLPWGAIAAPGRLSPTGRPTKGNTRMYHYVYTHVQI